MVGTAGGERKVVGRGGGKRGEWKKREMGMRDRAQAEHTCFLTRKWVEKLAGGCCLQSVGDWRSLYSRKYTKTKLTIKMYKCLINELVKCSFTLLYIE